MICPSCRSAGNVAASILPDSAAVAARLHEDCIAIRKDQKTLCDCQHQPHQEDTSGRA